MESAQNSILGRKVVVKSISAITVICPLSHNVSWNDCFTPA